MIPLVDVHCHLLAGLDDGPRTDEDALAMCEIAFREGVRMACATAHQNDRWQAVTPPVIRAATKHLTERLHATRLPLSVFPCAEVMFHPDLEADWTAGKLLTVADLGSYLLVEMPHGLFVDVRHVVRNLVARGVRPVLAHPERCPELLEDSGPLEELIAAGCLVQVSTGSITAPPDWLDVRELRDWFRRGLVHLIGSDGHSPRRRPPHVAEAYRQIGQWVGDIAADRICSTNGLAVLQGLPLRVPTPRPRARRWFFGLW